MLAAVEVSRACPFRHPARLYAVLLAGLAVAWLVPPTSLLSLAPVPRFLAAATLAFLPIFMANLVFTQRFKDTASSTTAFGANLLGAMVGGLLEYRSLIIGYRRCCPSSRSCTARRSWPAGKATLGGASVPAPAAAAVD